MEWSLVVIVLRNRGMGAALPMYTVVVLLMQ